MLKKNNLNDTFMKYLSSMLFVFTYSIAHGPCAAHASILCLMVASTGGMVSLFGTSEESQCYILNCRAADDLRVTD